MEGECSTSQVQMVASEQSAVVQIYGSKGDKLITVLGKWRDAELCILC